MWNTWQCAVLMATAVLAYFFIPSRPPPPGALEYERTPAVLGPDLLGFFVTSLLIALPFWARMGEPYLWDDFGVLVHPAAILSWPVALLFSFILVTAARHACFWILIRPDGLDVGTSDQTRFVGFDQIKTVRPYRGGLPEWLKWLAPVLAVTGRYTAAGALLTARDTTGLSLDLKDGSTLTISEDAFEKPFARILAALQDSSVPVSGVFAKRFRKG